MFTVKRDALAGAPEVGVEGVEDAESEMGIRALAQAISSSGAESWDVAITEGSVIVLVEG